VFPPRPFADRRSLRVLRVGWDADVDWDADGNAGADGSADADAEADGDADAHADAVEGWGADADGNTDADGDADADAIGDADADWVAIVNCETCGDLGYVMLRAIEGHSAHCGFKPSVSVEHSKRKPHTGRHRRKLQTARVRHVLVSFRAPCDCEAGKVWACSTRA